VITIMSLFSTIILYIKSKKVKLPCYAVRSYRIIGDLIKDVDLLKIYYSGEAIENLTATKIAFWNAGNDTLNWEDISKSTSLSINVGEGYKILDAKILKVIEPANQFMIYIAEDKSHINMHFEYLDKDQGAIIQLLHTGISENDVKILGKIKGVGEPKQIKYTGRSRDCLPSTVLIFWLGFPILPMIIGIINGNLFVENIFEDVINTALFLMMWWGLLYFILKTMLPKGFKIFEEEYKSCV